MRSFLRWCHWGCGDGSLSSNVNNCGTWFMDVWLRLSSCLNRFLKRPTVVKYCRSTTWFHRNFSMSPSTNTGTSAEVVTWRQSESQELHRGVNQSYHWRQTETFSISQSGSCLLQLPRCSWARPRTRWSETAERDLTPFVRFWCFCRVLGDTLKRKSRRRRRKEVHIWHSAISVHRAFLLESVSPKSGVKRSDFLHKWISHSRMETKTPQNWNRNSRLE